MSLIASTPQQICNSPVNTSPSKQQYSFAKCDRFKSTKYQGCDNFYELPSALSKRSTTLGRGTKYDFTKERGQGVPPPNAYDQPTDFDRRKPHSPAYKFGISREQAEKQYIEGHFKPDPAVPGPGSYTPVKQFGSDARKASLRPRTSALDAMFSSHKGPGPAAYSPKLGFAAKNHDVLSTFKNVGTLSWTSGSSGERFPLNRETLKNPGPGKYSPNLEIQANGTYFLSKFKSSMCRTFPHSPRSSHKTARSIDTPGPGSYRLPSDFGYYDSKNVARPNTQSLPSLNAHRAS
mmetsp:Transcript_6729/g.11989  ORF Transcript_6729/g.11989 Transcript_6729/m.11989 type:complete len:291 (+) Transcript_6729:201-1073(+)